MKKCNIFIPRGKRSNWGLIDPIIKRMKNDPFFEVTSGDIILRNIEYFDLILITGDREEMFFYAYTFFIRNIPIIHFYSGILNSFATKDDIYRHQITLMSDLQLCESKRAYINTCTLLDSIQKKPNAFIIPITHLEDINPCMDLVPELPFDLVLYNPIIDKEQQKKDIKQIEDLINGQNFIHIGSPDINNIKLQHYNSFFHEYYKNINDRNQFLGLLSKCERLITNSSIVYYEAPFIMKKDSKIIQIGNRNNTRSTVPNELEIKGGSTKIIEIIKNYWRNKNG